MQSLSDVWALSIRRRSRCICLRIQVCYRVAWSFVIRMVWSYCPKRVTLFLVTFLLEVGTVFVRLEYHRSPRIRIFSISTSWNRSHNIHGYKFYWSKWWLEYLELNLKISFPKKTYFNDTAHNYFVHTVLFEDIGFEIKWKSRYKSNIFIIRQNFE